MFKIYEKLDPVIEAFLLDGGMSARSTDFMMMFVGCIALVVMSLMTLGLIILYTRILIASYRHMIYNKSPRLRRNWSIVFMLTIVSAVINYIVFSKTKRGMFPLLFLTSM